MSRGGRGSAVGIDLGTTYSRVAVCSGEDRHVHIITNEPSCVTFDKTGVLVGDLAKTQIRTNPYNTISHVKRFLGRKASNRRVQKDMISLPFSFMQGPFDKPLIMIQRKEHYESFSPEEICSLIIKSLKKSAETFLRKEVTHAVITVPAHFNIEQRQAIQNAATLAGLNVLQLINEQAAAMIAYLSTRKEIVDSKDKNVLVFDLGGGMFGLSLIRIRDSFYIRERDVGGVAHLGGEDFDRIMVNHCVHEIMKRHRKDVSNDVRAMGILKDECERAKRELSSTRQTSIKAVNLYEGIDFTMDFTRSKFEELNSHLFEKCIRWVDDCLKRANMVKTDIDEIYLVGGSTCIPTIQDLLMKFFDGRIMCQRINADEPVAYGAAMLAAKLSDSVEEVPDSVQSHVTPLSLGIKVQGDEMSFVIPRNTPIPVTVKMFYKTGSDYQPSIPFEVYQGESKDVTNNKRLGVLTFNGIPGAKAGEQRIQVCFSIDANGMLNVSAELLSTGNKVSTDIAENVSPEDIEEMLRKVDVRNNEVTIGGNMKLHEILKTKKTKKYSSKKIFITWITKTFHRFWM